MRPLLREKHASGKVIKVVHYGTQCTIQPPSCSLHNALHSPSIIGAILSPTLVEKTENCLYIYIYGTCVFRIIMHSAFLCVTDAIFPPVIHVERSS